MTPSSQLSTGDFSWMAIRALGFDDSPIELVLHYEERARQKRAERIEAARPKSMTDALHRPRSLQGGSE